MPRKYVRKMEKKGISAETLSKAIQDVMNKEKTIRQATDEYGGNEKYTGEKEEEEEDFQYIGRRWRIDMFAMSRPSG